jgi:hypothetical protein
MRASRTLLCFALLVVGIAMSKPASALEVLASTDLSAISGQACPCPGPSYCVCTHNWLGCLNDWGGACTMLGGGRWAERQHVPYKTCQSGGATGNSCYDSLALRCCIEWWYSDNECLNPEYEGDGSEVIWKYGNYGCFGTPF